MTSNDRSQHELQVNTSALPIGLWERFLEAIYQAYLTGRQREMHGHKNDGADPFLASARFWWRV